MFSTTLLILSLLGSTLGILFPRDSESRDSRPLDGMWQFRACPSLEPSKGFDEAWYSGRLWDTGETIDMPVPASYNDVTTDVALRDFTGWVWYDRDFFLPRTWKLDESKVLVRVGGTNYDAIVWINGEQIMTHSGPYLPFETDISSYLNPSESNIITIATNNTLSENSVPQGLWEWREESTNYAAGTFDQTYTFDFFNYGGLSRPIVLYTVPKNVSITGITTQSDVSLALDGATLTFAVDVDSASEFHCFVTLIDKAGAEAGNSTDCSGVINVPNARLWWPYTMNADAGYMYDLKVTVYKDFDEWDIYRQPVGLRQIAWDSNQVLINHSPFYFHGVNKHEDSNIRGRGLDLALVARDFNLMKWAGVNSFRTSHYPYADEILQMADTNGIVVISECSGVNLHTFNQELQDNHERLMQQLIIRDRNHPSVVMWSIANEPLSAEPAARDYFQAVADLTRVTDPTRPVTIVLLEGPTTDLGAYAVDVICVNRYIGWYTDCGRLDVIERQLTAEIRAWRSLHGKPVMISEYGADTVHGFHDAPGTIWTEEFQTDLMSENFRSFDTCRAEGDLIGELIWNFADFMTKQGREFSKQFRTR